MDHKPFYALLNIIGGKGATGISIIYCCYYYYYYYASATWKAWLFRGYLSGQSILWKHLVAM